jgi:hypothetical protein
MPMEINGRVWGSIALPIRAGLDFPALAAELHVSGRKPGEDDIRYRTGVECRNLELELRWVSQALRRRAAPDGRELRIRRSDALRVLADLTHPRTELDIQTWSDPGPGVVDTIGAIGRLTGVALGRSLRRAWTMCSIRSTIDSVTRRVSTEGHRHRTVPVQRSRHAEIHDRTQHPRNRYR